MHPQFTQNRQAFPRQIRDCLRDYKDLTFPDGH
jgi:hypothetical protein